MNFDQNKNVESGKNKQRRAAEAGFTLLEMVVAMVIFLVVTGAIYGLLQVGRLDRNRSSRRTDMLKNARAAIHLMGRDALNAGLSYHKTGASVPDNFLANRFGLPADADTDRDFLTSIVVGNDVFTNDLQNSATAKTDTVTFAWRDLDFNTPTAANRPDSASTTQSGRTVLLQSASAGASNATRVTAKEAGGLAAANQYDLYMVQTGSQQVLVMATRIVDTNRIDFAPGDPLGINQSYNGTGTNRSLLRPCATSSEENCTVYNNNPTLKRVRMVNYKVKQDGTLVRQEYGNNAGQPADQQMQEQPLAYNVKDMQIRYLLNDGRVTDNPVAGVDGILGTADDQPLDVNLITQMTITLKVAATDTDEQTGKADTITLNATFSTRNLQYSNKKK